MRVPEPGRVALPRQRSAGGAAVDAGDPHVDEVARRRVVQVQGAVLGAMRGQRDGDEAPVGRGVVPVDRGGPARVDRVRVDEHAFGCRVAEIGQGDEERLLPRWLELEREVRVAGPPRVSVRGGVGREDLFGSAADLLVGRQRPQVGHRALVLRLGPRLRLFGLRVLEPAIVLRHVNTVIGGGDGHAHRLDGVELNHRCSLAPSCGWMIVSVPEVVTWPVHERQARRCARAASPL